MKEGKQGLVKKKKRFRGKTELNGRKKEEWNRKKNRELKRRSVI